MKWTRTGGLQAYVQITGSSKSVQAHFFMSTGHYIRKMCKHRQLWGCREDKASYTVFLCLFLNRHICFGKDWSRIDCDCVCVFFLILGNTAD